MIVLDTNVISELLRPSPEVRVESWLSAQAAEDVFLTSITEAELRFGVGSMADGKRKSGLSSALDKILMDLFQGRILSFGSEAAVAYAEIASNRKDAGRPISQFDCQIAAICRANSAAIATRNIRDFEGCGMTVIDPWGFTTLGRR